MGQKTLHQDIEMFYADPMFESLNYLANFGEFK